MTENPVYAFTSADLSAMSDSFGASRQRVGKNRKRAKRVVVTALGEEIESQWSRESGIKSAAVQQAGEQGR